MLGCMNQHGPKLKKPFSCHQGGAAGICVIVEESHANPIFVSVIRANMKRLTLRSALSHACHVRAGRVADK